jgi:hypothetical protein
VVEPLDVLDLVEGLEALDVRYQVVVEIDFCEGWGGVRG